MKKVLSLSVSKLLLLGGLTILIGISAGNSFGDLRSLASPPRQGASCLDGHPDGFCGTSTYCYGGNLVVKEEGDPACNYGKYSQCMDDNKTRKDESIKCCIDIANNTDIYKPGDMCGKTIIQPTYEIITNTPVPPTKEAPTPIPPTPTSVPPYQTSSDKKIYAFYYAWQSPEVLNGLPDEPILGKYKSYYPDDREKTKKLLREHIRQAERAGIDGFIISWLGKSQPTVYNYTDSVLNLFLDITEQESEFGNFEIGVDLEHDQIVNKYDQNLIDAMIYLRDSAMKRKNYPRYQGKNLLFFWRTQNRTIDEWRSIRDQIDPQHQMYWLADNADNTPQGTYLRYVEAGVFDNQNWYSVTWPDDGRPPYGGDYVKWERFETWLHKLNSQLPYFATISPGFSFHGKEGPNYEVPREYIAYNHTEQLLTHQCQESMKYNPQFIILTSFNEWAEGSYIEASKNFGDFYINLMRDCSNQFKNQYAQRVNN